MGVYSALHEMPDNRKLLLEKAELLKIAAVETERLVELRVAVEVCKRFHKKVGENCVTD